MARMLRIVVLALACALCALPASASAASDPLLAPESACPGQTDGSLPRSVQAQIMLCMHNWARAQEHRSGLSASKKLRVSSSRKAHDIKRCGQFSHYACRRDAFYWERRVGFLRGTYGVGENLVLTVGAESSVRDAMAIWLNSSAHRHNLLAPEFREIGISLVTGRFHRARNAHIWVAQLGYHRH